MENGRKILQTYFQETIFHHSFLNEICATKCELEMDMNIPGYSPNTFLNHDITVKEVKRAVDNAKLKKATGIEGIPNEALKSPHFLKRYSFIFSRHALNIIPSAWYKSIIKPVPKFSLETSHTNIYFYVQPVFML